MTCQAITLAFCHPPQCHVILSYNVYGMSFSGLGKKRQRKKLLTLILSHISSTFQCHFTLKELGIPPWGDVVCRNVMGLPPYFLTAELLLDP